MYFLKISIRAWMLMVVLATLSIATSTASAATSAQEHPTSSCGTWQVAPGPNVGSINNDLSAVAAISSSDIWSVGYTYSSQVLTPSHTLTIHWNGSRWSIVPSPNVGSYSNFLRGVAAVSPQDVWAVGYFAGNIDSTLTEHWNGSSWSAVPSRNRQPPSDGLGAVTVISAHDIWAVGFHILPDFTVRTLFEHYC